jgi:hypothetical protein
MIATRIEWSDSAPDAGRSQSQFLHFPRNKVMAKIDERGVIVTF